MRHDQSPPSGLAATLGTAPLGADGADPAAAKTGVELVDARGGIAHRISPEAMLDGRLAGVCRALCGAQVLVASLTDPGRGQCRRCRS